MSNICLFHFKFDDFVLWVIGIGMDQSGSFATLWHGQAQAVYPDQFIKAALILQGLDSANLLLIPLAPHPCAQALKLCERQGFWQLGSKAQMSTNILLRVLRRV